MKRLKLICVFIFSSLINTYGQKKVVYHSYAAAFQQPEKVKVLSISCIHNNALFTDGCHKIHPKIHRLKNLESLILLETDIKTFPKAMGKLKSLKHLELYNNWDINYEKELCELVVFDSLEVLEVPFSGIKRLPSCIGQIKSLKEINLSQNHNLDIASTFSILKQLPKLETLDLGGWDSLMVVPLEIHDLPNLKNIVLDYHRHQKGFDFKTSFIRLSILNLKSIILSNNGLKSLPKEVTLLEHLEYIDLSENLFDSIPPEVSVLPNIKEIKIRSNHFTFKYIGENIHNLQKLEKLDLSHNWKLDGQTTIVYLSVLPNLKDLNFFSCRLDSIPNEMKNFKALEKLDISRNPKIDFSDLFTKLISVKSLKSLVLDDNKLTTLPKEIGMLSNLEYLSLGQNPIEVLPEEFFQLKNLKILNAYGNFGTRLADSEIEKVKEKLPNCKIIKEWFYKN